MSVHIKILDKPNLIRTKMNCDQVINDKLLQQGQMTEECFSTNHFTIIVGKMGSGKTSTAVSLIKTWKKCFENIYVFMPENSRSSIENDIFGKNLPEDQLFSELTIDNLEDVYERLQENSSNGENSLILIDDFQNLLKDKLVSASLEKILIKIRHLRTTALLLAQSYQKIPKFARELAFNLILFDLGKSALLRIFEEVIDTKKEKFDEIIKLAFDKPHNWILINLHKSKKLYKNFDEIIFD